MAGLTSCIPVIAHVHPYTSHRQPIVVACACLWSVLESALTTNTLVFFAECRVLKSSYSRASAAKYSGSKSPGPSRRSKSPASGRNRKAVDGLTGAVLFSFLTFL